MFTWGSTLAVREEPPVRLVFVEPPPPPRAPLGVADGTGSVAALPRQDSERVRREADDTQPTIRREPQRLARTAARAKLKPERSTPPASETPQEPDDVAPGTTAGATNGEAGGGVGGVAGGVMGGTLGGTGSGPVPLGQVAHRPILVRRVSPVYPEEARRRAVEGLVLLEAVLDLDGAVERDVKILNSVPMLDRAAVAAVRQWRFRPARNETGHSLRVILEIPIRFVLR